MNIVLEISAVVSPMVALVVGIENQDRRGGEHGQKRDGGEREPAQGLPSVSSSLCILSSV